MTDSFNAVGAMRKAVKRLAIVAGLRPSREEFTRQLQVEKARLGSLIFGEVPAGRHREFYQQDATTWVWNEMIPRNGQYESLRVEYKTSPGGVYKSVNGKDIGPLRGKELFNFSEAVKEYSYRFKRYLSAL